MSAPATVWDAVVVGAGPAGSATAARLAALGHRVLLLDRSGFPRAKPCGECVNPAGVSALQRLGALPAVLAGAHAPLSGWLVRAREGDTFEGRFPTGDRGIAVSRRDLDMHLLEHARVAGAVVRTGTRVGDVVREKGATVGVRLGGAGGDTIRARLVVGADGLRSVVVRRLGLLRRAPRLRKLALTAHLRGLDVLSGRGELHLVAEGCLGIAAVGGGIANVTLVVSGDEMARVAGGRERYFDGVTRRLARLAGGVRVGGVLATGPFDWPIRRAVADGALLVGDAAGYYDPFTGQGIYRALRGAELAADSADRALRSGDLSAAALAPYERARREAFAPGERVQHLVEAFVARPRLLGWAARRFRAEPRLADRLIAVTGDILPARSLLDPALLLRLVLLS